MSSDNIVLRVANVSKRFELYDHPKDQLKQFILPRLRRLVKLSHRQYFHEFWALRDVSLEVLKGESCGIVGLNGSGKSTLLQIITGTLAPTLGEVSTKGRIAALLELGSGFNPEFSGRENVFMNGALLGFTRKQIAEKLDDIQAFADIGTHFDQPLSTYSSGMQMRIAFAVATLFDPDILIIDEALAVGDAYFQQKCFQRLEQFKQSGGTLLFVSHDPNAVKHLCDKALLISHGQAISYGTPRDVIDLYQGLVARMSDTGEREITVVQAEQSIGSWTKATTVTTNHDADLVDFQLLDKNGNRITCIESEQELTVQYTVRLHKDFDRPAFGLIVRDRLGRSVFETTTYGMHKPDSPIASTEIVVVRFVVNFNVKAGRYSFSAGVANRGFARSEFEEYSLLMHDVEQLEVLESPSAIFYGGIFNMNPTVSLKTIEKSDA